MLLRPAPHAKIRIRNPLGVENVTDAMHLVKDGINRDHSFGLDIGDRHLFALFQTHSTYPNRRHKYFMLVCTAP